MMTRKDYIETANILNAFYFRRAELEPDEMKFLTNSFADMFELDNPRFDRKRFKEAVYKDA